eukprot:TRINITY_DN1058_c1_g1_i18.p2 TRINITY_DN1058_c1_g1~~TRINITY_DN1058_c1_g1_i18.p2  ORF type:complete len:537 (+),score=129.26 TRINITY_DN1058_c1_g1_i18:511-2121(+)
MEDMAKGMDGVVLLSEESLLKVQAMKWSGIKGVLTKQGGDGRLEVDIVVKTATEYSNKTMFLTALSGRVELVAPTGTVDIDLGKMFVRVAKEHASPELWERMVNGPHGQLRKMGCRGVLRVDKHLNGVQRVDALVTLPKERLAGMLKDSGKDGVFLKLKDGKLGPVAWLPKDTTLDVALAQAEAEGLAMRDGDGRIGIRTTEERKIAILNKAMGEGARLEGQHGEPTWKLTGLYSDCSEQHVERITAKMGWKGVPVRGGWSNGTRCWYIRGTKPPTDKVRITTPTGKILNCRITSDTSPRPMATLKSHPGQTWSRKQSSPAGAKSYLNAAAGVAKTTPTPSSKTQATKDSPDTKGKVQKNTSMEDRLGAIEKAIQKLSGRPLKKPKESSEVLKLRKENDELRQEVRQLQQAMTELTAQLKVFVKQGQRSEEACSPQYGTEMEGTEDAESSLGPPPTGTDTDIETEGGDGDEELLEEGDLTICVTGKTHVFNGTYSTWRGAVCKICDEGVHKKNQAQQCIINECRTTVCRSCMEGGW